MGIFSKLKQNLTHGGVKIEMTAPERVEQGQTTVPVQVRLMASDSTQTVKTVAATIERQYFSTGSNDEVNHQPDQIASKTYPTPFELPAGQTLQLDLAIDLTGADQPGADNPTLVAAANILDRASKAYNTLNQRQFKHYVKVVADVDGVAIDPSVSQRIILDGREASHVQIGLS